MTIHASAVRYGFWSSSVILACGVGLIIGIVASAVLLPAAMTTRWEGMTAYAAAYRSTGGTLTTLTFLAALISCPAYVVQVASIHSLDPIPSRIRRWIGLAFAIAFALLAGLNYIVQLTVVRAGILAGQTTGLDDLVFQNPGSWTLELDFLGWFFLGLALLTVVPVFGNAKTNRVIRWVLLANAGLGFLLVGGVALHSPAIGQVVLAAITAILLCADVLLLVFFDRARGPPLAHPGP